MYLLAGLGSEVEVEAVGEVVAVGEGSFNSLALRFATTGGGGGAVTSGDGSMGDAGTERKRKINEKRHRIRMMRSRRRSDQRLH